MNKTRSIKLSLNRETLKNLASRDLDRVRGGLKRTLAYGCPVKTEDCETEISCDLTDDCTWQTQPLPK